LFDEIVIFIPLAHVDVDQISLCVDELLGGDAVCLDAWLAQAWNDSLVASTGFASGGASPMAVCLMIRCYCFAVPY